ncbi:MAG: hypothetical protein P8R54_10235 [Myxococcota bacterium]|nr:hypothetical protein [Myxococcota bacterium]
MLTADSPLSLRIAGYLGERFPPVVYTVLVVLFFGSAVLNASALTAAPLSWRVLLGAPVVWLVFFHLRVFDEHKDFSLDVIAHPERLLSRGVVTLPLLARLAGAAILMEGLLSVLLGWPALAAWAAALVFSVLMRLEFGVGEWLSSRILLYAVTHNPIVGLLALVGFFSIGAGFSPRFLWYVAAASLASLAFELGRKIRLPEEEIAGVDSYSSVHGRARAGLILSGVILGAAGLTGVAVWTVSPSVGQHALSGVLVLLGALVGIVEARPGRPAKKVELGSALFLLIILLAMGIAAW